MKDTVEASVIIPTFNGGKKIPTLLNALLLQTAANFEIIVVIDGSTDHTAEVLESYKEKFLKFTVVHQSNRGRSAAKNAGAKNASSDILIFFDDDMQPLDNSIELHIAFHTSHKGIVTGNILEIDRKDNPDVINYKAFLTQRWISKYDEGCTQLDSSTLFFSAANCSCSKSVFEKLGGFDERLADAEDIDLAYRALDMNILVYFDKYNKAIHHDRITARSYVKRLRAYGAAHAAIKKLHPQRIPVRSTKKNIIKRVIYRAFANELWIQLIDDNYFTFLPKRIRYSLYSIIMHALSVEFPNAPLKV